MKEASGYNMSKDPCLINCKTECGNGKCYAKTYALYAEKNCPNYVEPKPITNADRIRAMTDEELADEILSWFNWLNAVEWDDKRIIEWLKQETQDANDNN